MKFSILKIISLCYYFYNASWPAVLVLISIYENFSYYMEAALNLFTVITPLIIRTYFFASKFLIFILKKISNFFFKYKHEKSGINYLFLIN